MTRARIRDESDLKSQIRDLHFHPAALLEPLLYI
jgi:hypothetical protein